MSAVPIKTLNDHLLITIFCYLDVTTLLKSVNVTCKEFNSLLRSPISSGLIWSQHWPYSISYGYNVNMEEEEEEEQSSMKSTGSGLPSWSGNLDYESFRIFRNLEISLLKLLSSSISGFEYSRARSSSTLKQVMVFIRQHIGLEHLCTPYHYDDDVYHHCYSLSGLPGLVDLYSINKPHCFSIGQRRFISGCLVAFLNLLTNLVNLLDREVDLYSDVSAPESFVDLSSETLFKGDKASIIQSLCHLGGAVGNTGAEEGGSLFAHFIKPPVAQRGFSAEELTQLRSLMAKALTYVKSVEHARRWDIILACRQKESNGSDNSDSSGSNANNGNKNSNSNNNGNANGSSNGNSNSGTVVDKEGQDPYLIEGFHCIGQIKNNYQRDFVNHVVATTATLVWRELVPDLFPEGSDKKRKNGTSSSESNDIHRRNQGHKGRERSEKVDVLYQHILNPEHSADPSTAAGYRPPRSISNEGESNSENGGFLSLSRRDSLASEGSVKEGVLDGYSNGSDKIAYSSGYAYYEDSWTRMRSEISQLSAQVLFRVKMLSGATSTAHSVISPSLRSQESREQSKYESVLTYASFPAVITYMRDHAITTRMSIREGEEGSPRSGSDMLGGEVGAMFTSRHQSGLLDRFSKIRVKLREAVKAVEGRAVIQCIIDKIYGTHENFTTRTADSRNEDATVDARSSRRRDRSMSLTSSNSSDGEDDAGGPALNMSSPSHSSYYVSTNSYLDTAIYTKMGIPITLSTFICLVGAEVGLELIQDQGGITVAGSASNGSSNGNGNGNETEMEIDGTNGGGGSGGTGGNSSASKLYVVGMRGHVITGFHDPLSRLREASNPYSTLSSTSTSTVRGGVAVQDCLYIDPFEPHELMTATQVFHKFPFLQHNYSELTPTVDIETWLRVMRNLLHVEMQISNALHAQMFQETMPAGMLSAKFMVGGVMHTSNTSNNGNGKDGNTSNGKDDKDGNSESIYTLPTLSSALKAHLLVTDSDCRKYLLRLQSEILTEHLILAEGGAEGIGSGMEGSMTTPGGSGPGGVPGQGGERVYMNISASLHLIRERLQAAISLGLPYAIEDLATQLMYSDILTAGGLPGNSGSSSSNIVDGTGLSFSSPLSSGSRSGSSATNTTAESVALFMRDKPVYKQLKEMLSKAKIREASISV